MKRLFSILLAAVLVMACFPVTASAAASANVSVSSATAEPGSTVAITYTVTGEFANYEMILTSESPITVNSVSGVTYGAAKQKVAFAKDENVTSHSFTVTFNVPADIKAGEYDVSANVLFISDRDLVDADYSVDGGVIVIEAKEEPTTPPVVTVPTEPETEPTVAPTEPETEPTVPTVPETEPTVAPTEPETEPTVAPTEPETEPTVPTVPETEPTVPTVPETQPTETEPTIPVVTDPTETEPDEPTQPEDPDDPNLDDDKPSKTGDITTQVTMGIGAAVICMIAAVAFVFKRKTAK